MMLFMFQMASSNHRSRSSYNSAWAKRRRVAKATALEAEKLEFRWGDVTSSFDEIEIEGHVFPKLEKVDHEVIGEVVEVEWPSVESECTLDVQMPDASVPNEDMCSFSDSNDVNSDVSMLTECYEFDPDEYVEQFTENLHIENGNKLSDTPNLSATQALAQWARDTNVPHTAVDLLLKTLKKINPESIHELPSTARTLMSTNKFAVVTKRVSGMQYTNMGVKASLISHLMRYPVETRKEVDILEISLNVDGLPLFQSSKKGVWPVLCQLHLDPVSVFPLSISFGSTKPDSLDFLRENIDELKEIMQGGLEIDDRLMAVKVRAVVCDAPARALVKDVKNHNAYYGCERCHQKGMWVRKTGGKGGRVTFQDTRYLFDRTDESFRSVSQAQHHLHPEASTPFKELPIDLVKDFPLDYMHQICLGVMRRLLMVWLRGPVKERVLSREAVERLDGRLVSLRSFVTKDFARKPRATDELEHWKATEYRQFLLYTGYHVLRDLLPPNHYTNFMALSVACMILVSPSLVARHVAYAKKLMRFFVETARDVYGAHFLVYNVHMMLHVADDAARFGSLDNCSGFPFENYLHKMKRLVRSGKSPLVQLVTRLNEHSNLEDVKVPEKKLEISAKFPDNAYVLDNNACAIITARLNEFGPEENRKAMCVLYTDPEPVFVEPCNSMLLDIYKFRKRNHNASAVTSVILESRIARKAVMTEHSDRVVFQGILHKRNQ